MACTSSFPTGRLLEIVFTFDTTGSMSSILDEVRGRLQDMIQRLQSDIPGIRIGVIAHGDYCDKDVFYLTKEMDLCQNIAELFQFVKDIEGTGGGDVDECYELILQLVRTNFSWSANSQKILVMIGDANPHEPDYEMNTDKIDWREELKHMKSMGIKVYGVQVFDNAGVDAFYKSLASETDGHYLKLTQFSNICDLMMAICYAERGENFLLNYENEVRSRFEGTTSKGHSGIATGSLPKDLEGAFVTLRRDHSLKSISSLATISVVSEAVLPLPAIKPVITPAAIKPVRRKDKAQLGVKQHGKILPHREFRENFSTKQYDSRCSCQSSTKWHLVYSPQNPKISGWRCRRLRNKNVYWKKRTMFPNLANDRGIYELAVQTETRRKLHVVYSHVVAIKTGSLMKTENWERALFRSKYQKNIIMRYIRNACANNKCRIFLRRITVSKRTVTKFSAFDFAWQNSSPRLLIKNGVCISRTTETMDTH